MKEKPNYYAIIPATVRYDTRLKANEKLLYGEITALTEKTGECWASNKYFCNLYEVKENAIATWIRSLKNNGYIEVIYQYKGKEIEQRIIKIGTIQKDNTPYSKRYRGTIQKGEENTTSTNTNKETISKDIVKKNNFTKPTLDELKNYTKEHNLKIDEERFIDYYEAKGWMIGKNKMKDWKAAARNWNRNEKQPKEGTREKLERILKDD